MSSYHFSALDEGWDDDFDDEDWYDDDEDESDDEDFAHCPECAEPIHAIADKCPACGYLLLAADRRTLSTKNEKPLWFRATAVIVLVAFLSSLFAVAVNFFF